MSKSLIKPAENSIANILENYKDNLTAVESYFEKFGNIAEDEDEDALRKSGEYLNHCLEDIGFDLKSFETYINSDEDKINDNSDGNKSINLTSKDLIEFAKKISSQPRLSLKNYEILSSSTFLILNNYFEYLLADLLTYYYFNFKNSLNSKEIKVSLLDISEYESIEELEKALIFREVETMLIELTFDGLLEHFQKKLSINLVKNIIDWDEIKEYRERRHIIVHNASIINKKYQVRTGNPYDLEIGDKINISKAYFKKALNNFKLAGILLSFNCWGNWEKENLDKAIHTILMESFHSLSINELNNCLNFTDYAEQITPKNEYQEDLLLRLKFNKCIALKKLDHTKELDDLLKKINVGTASPLFKLAYAILSDNKNDSILKLIEQTYAIGEIEMSDYLEWPLFSFVREKPKLNKEVIAFFESKHATDD